MGRWFIRDVAEQAARDGIVERISPSHTWAILDEADCQPHRTTYWITSQDPAFKEKARDVLALYECAEDLLAEGTLVVCLNEKPNLQALGRKYADHPPRPGRPRLREFEYVRHGTVNLLLANAVATGEVWGTTLDRCDRHTFIAALEDLVTHFGWAERIVLVMDNHSAHRARDTGLWLDSWSGYVTRTFTPTHASWLNQAECALSRFSRKYLHGFVSASRAALQDQIRSGLVDFNEHYASPQEWSFTRHSLEDWYATSELSPNFAN